MERPSDIAASYNLRSRPASVGTHPASPGQSIEQWHQHMSRVDPRLTAGLILSAPQEIPWRLRLKRVFMQFSNRQIFSLVINISHLVKCNLF